MRSSQAVETDRFEI